MDNNSTDAGSEYKSVSTSTSVSSSFQPSPLSEKLGLLIRGSDGPALVNTIEIKGNEYNYTTGQNVPPVLTSALKRSSGLGIHVVRSGDEHTDEVTLAPSPSELPIPGHKEIKTDRTSDRKSKISELSDPSRVVDCDSTNSSDVANDCDESFWNISF